MLNVGTADRIIRIIVGLAVVALVFVGPKTARGWLGLVPLATGVMGWCPLYSVVKVGTRPRPA
jgi:hypothetical protein